MTMTVTTLMQSEIPGLKLSARGKVRDIYDLGDRLLIVATDRLSAFDVVLPTPIPDKGRVLTQTSAFWFKKTAHLVPNHLLSADFDEIVRQLPGKPALDRAAYDGRMMLCKKAKRFDAECVVRGYLAGSGWKEYKKSQSVCGHKLPAGLDEAARLPEPIFTPSTKAEQGHDENIDLEQLAKIVGAGPAKELEKLTLELYKFGADFMRPRGLILADTKFEFGLLDGKIILIDEAMTPDSSRFWDAKLYRTGTSPESFDKQFVRDYLERIGWDKNPPGPALPSDVVEGTSRRYREALERLAK
ncbi:MAG: phosphoribosylaminoimidazolesuccinocarboxamide synthase [Elusimicrobia bacterium]|nr:phosphoribosylaminoimidazolesuccinocarboxamide synthase [Elusimicrobiota bacterium]